MLEKFTMSKYMRAKLAALRKNPARFIWARITSLKYDIKCFFFPHNVVRVHGLHRTWCDRDVLMFHAMFQILVDFVELEQPYRDYTDRGWLDGSRYTDLEAMKAYVDKYRGDVGEDQYAKDMEVLYIYEWYKNEKFDLDKFALHEKTGQKLVFEDHTIKRVDTGKPKLITWDELRQIEDDHRTTCNVMLRRILAIREHLWT